MGAMGAASSVPPKPSHYGRSFHLFRNSRPAMGTAFICSATAVPLWGQLYLFRNSRPAMGTALSVPQQPSHYGDSFICSATAVPLWGQLSSVPQQPSRYGDSFICSATVVLLRARLQPCRHSTVEKGALAPEAHPMLLELQLHAKSRLNSFLSKTLRKNGRGRV